MANLITQTIVLDSELEVQSAYVKHLPHFNQVQVGRLYVQIQYFKDKAASDIGSFPIRPKNLDDKDTSGFIKNLTPEEINSLTPSILQGYVTEYLGTLWEPANITVVE